MNPILHPLAKTSIELRRSITRLQTLKQASPFDPHVQSGIADNVIEYLRLARECVPKDLRDTDLLENQKDADD